MRSNPYWTTFYTKILLVSLILYTKQQNGPNMFIGAINMHPTIDNLGLLKQIYDYLYFYAKNNFLGKGSLFLTLVAMETT